MTQNRLPENLTIGKSKALVLAYLFYLSEDATKEIKQKSFSNKESSTYYENYSAYFDDLVKNYGISENISNKELGIKVQSWYETLTQKPEYSTPTTSNIPEKGVREVQEEERLFREEETLKSKQKGKEQSEEFLAQQKERAERIKNLKVTVAQNPESIQIVELSPEDKKKLFDLGKSAQQDPFTTEKIIEDKIFQAIDIGNNGDIKNNIPKSTITKVSTEFVENIKQFGDFSSIEEIPSEMPAAINERSIITPLLNPNNEKFKTIVTDNITRNIIASDVSTLAAAIEANRNINYSFIKPILDSESIVTLFYGSPDITEYEILNEKEKEERNDGVEINLEDVNKKANDLRDIWRRFSSEQVVTEEIETTFYPVYTQINVPEISASVSSKVAGSLVAGGAITGFGLGTFQSVWAAQHLLNAPTAELIGNGLTEAQIIGMSAATTNGILINSSFMFSAGNFSLGFITASTPTQGIFAAQAAFGQNAVRLLAVQTGSKVTIGLGTKALGQAVGTAATTAITATGGAATGAVIGTVTVPLPLLGTILGAIGGFFTEKVIKKIPWEKIKKFGAEIGGFAAGLMVFPFFGAGPAFITGGATWAGIKYASGGAPAIQASTSNFLTGVTSALGFALEASLAGMGGPILVILLGFPVIIALILFIINSGAYVVPPSLSSLASQNQYIDVQKTANPPGPFKNSDLPLKITYTVTITAKKETLTNVTVTDDCSVITKNGSQKCTAQAQQPPDKTIQAQQPPDKTITVGNPFTFTYEANYNATYIDALITNTVNVNASVLSETSPQNVSGSTSIIIGNPPTECFVFDKSWSAKDQARETAAISKMSPATTYMATLCQGNNPITLHRIGNGSSCGGGGGETVGSTINLYDAGVNCTDFVTFYTLAHESGHVYAQRTSKYQLFQDFSPYKSEGFICTYPRNLPGYTDTPPEDFAEMIALYFTKVGGSVNSNCMKGQFNTAYPNHWKFAHDNIFYQNL